MPYEQLLLAAGKVIGPLYSACETLYEGWKTMRSFGSEFLTMHRLLELEYLRLMEIGQKRLHQMEQEIDPDDRSHPCTTAIAMILEEIIDTYKKIDDIVKELEENRPRRKLQKRRPLELSKVEAIHDTRHPDFGQSNNSVQPSGNTTRTTLALSQSTLERSGASSALDITRPTSISNLLVNISEGSTEAETVRKDKRKSKLSLIHTPRKAISKMFGKEKAKTDQVEPNNGQDSNTMAQTISRPETNEMPVSHLIPDISGKQRLADEAAAMADRLLRGRDSGQSSAIEIQNKSRTSQQILFVRKKEDLDRYIDHLELLNNKLDEWTRDKTGSGQAPTIKKSKATMDSMQTTASQTQNALHRVHECLRIMNLLNWSFSLRLSEDFAEDGKDFREDHDYLKFRKPRGDFFYFMFQRHALQGGKHTEFFVAETKIDHTDQDESALLPDPSEAATNLKQAEAFINKPLLPEETFTTWGTVLHHQDKSDRHRLFKDARNKWVAVGTLAELIGSGEASNMTPPQRIQLAAVLVYAYLYLATVRPSCQPIALSSFNYFALENEDMSWDEANPLILSPHLRFGFGQRKRRLIGGRTQKEWDNSMTSLGVILAQIGSCTLYAFDPQGALVWARKQLKTLDTSVSHLYAEIVSDCLEVSFEPIPGQDAENIKLQNAFFIDKARRLLKLKDTLKKTLAGSRIHQNQRPDITSSTK